MSDQQPGTETVGKSATQQQQQEEGSIVPPTETDPSGTDQGDGTKSPTIVEKEKSKGVTLRMHLQSTMLQGAKIDRP